MEPDEAFGPAEQRPALLDEAQALGAAQGLPPLSPSGQRLYQRYVAGELSLAQCANAMTRRNRPGHPAKAPCQPWAAQARRSGKGPRLGVGA